MHNDELFLQAVTILLNHEGGYSNDSNDCGGTTKYGISQKSYPHLDIRSLTLEAAKQIYYTDFWITQPYTDIIHANITLKLFDLAVNMGPKNAHRLVQRALRAAGKKINEDGILGPETITAINTASGIVLLAALKSEAAGYYRCIAALKPNQKKFLNGWLNRAYF